MPTVENGNQNQYPEARDFNVHQWRAPGLHQRLSGFHFHTGRPQIRERPWALCRFCDKSIRNGLQETQERLKK